jgi:nicotinamide mononucleotide adenylyltransferase
LPERLDPLQ